MTEFVEIKDIRQRDFREAMEIYTGAFPANERHPVEVISERVDKGLSRLYITRSDDEVVFIALLYPLKNSRFILLDYIATKPSHQGKGITSAFMRHLEDGLKGANLYLLLEVENPDYGNNKETRLRRLNLYKRLGAKEALDVRYVLPALQGSQPTEMLLMLYPADHDDKISAQLLKNTIVQIYKELYNRDENDPLLNEFIHDLRGSIQLG